MTEQIPQYQAVKDDAKELAKAEQAIRAQATTRNDRWYPRFHIASDGGWINDPNGLCFYRGRWHVYYQLHPYGTQWGPMHWGHVSSVDMVTWRREPVAMAPTLKQEQDGVFSGSAVVGDDGKLRFYYTGHRWANGHDGADGECQVQMLAEAVDNDAAHLKKIGMIIDCPKDKVDSHFRDPKVWKQGDTWYLIHGVSSAQRRGQIWLYSSVDMVHWEFERVLFEHDDPDVFMLECPDFYPLHDPSGRTWWVLCFSAMGSKAQGFVNRNANNAGYVVGSWEVGGPFTPLRGFNLWDWGHNFYAPQSFQAPDGRQIMYGWMSPFVKPIPMEDDGWCGQLTLARTITIDEDGNISSKPVDEITALREDKVQLDPLKLEVNEELLIAEDAEAVEIEVEFDMRHTSAERFGLRVHATSDGSYTYIAYDAQIGRVVIDRQAAVRGDRGYRAAPVQLGKDTGDILKLRVFVDRGSVEVYINDGSEVMSSYSYPSAGRRAVVLLSESGITRVNTLVMHHLADIGLE
ncbi:glycoside hydrolase family 32 protein [Bifidobacterium crudilactis]|uniref:glycoside hydrolase family 32 protein n=1 Tax=Bifidobacterium crudilactis TaxID=327277 RepID=UPI0023573983|nr:GH32 C-terminal domain-containing protein [Bifidobacterium crudilactis]MCI1218530.1 GH32 C-terminal domain-containing protein [Bifidobacterium crudilactis]